MRLDKIHQVMRNAALLGDGNFRRADIEAPIDLRGIADQNFAAEALRQRNSQRGFARGSRPQNHYEPRQRRHPENFQ